MTRTASSCHATARRRRAGVPALVIALVVVSLVAAGGAAALRAGPAAPPGPAAGAPSTLSSVPLEPPVIEGFSPTSGPVGTLVTVKGYWFAVDTQVRFNGTLATSVHVSPFTQLECTVPAGATSGPHLGDHVLRQHHQRRELHRHRHGRRRLDRDSSRARRRRSARRPS